jgi:hypothetical protein
MVDRREARVGRPARDEGPDIAESLQRSGFRSVWFAADILGAPD